MNGERKPTRLASGDSQMAIPVVQPQDIDVELMQGIRSGDDAALTLLIGRNERWLRGVVYAVLTDADLLDDVMQQVWLRVWQRAVEVEDVRRWRHWLYRMARNAAIDAGRKKTRRRKLWQRLGEEMLGRRDQDRTPGPLRMAAVAEDHGRLLGVVDAMPEIYREPFVLRHLEGMTYKQIAEALDLPMDTVGTRLVRARRLLQQSLDMQVG